jgi:hypothetical protein
MINPAASSHVNRHFFPRKSAFTSAILSRTGPDGSLEGVAREGVTGPQFGDGRLDASGPVSQSLIPKPVAGVHPATQFSAGVASGQIERRGDGDPT